MTAPAAVRTRHGRDTSRIPANSSPTPTAAIGPSRSPSSPTPTATVSTPLTWDELPGVTPGQFTVRTMPARFYELGDLHATIDDVATNGDAVDMGPKTVHEQMAQNGRAAEGENGDKKEDEDFKAMFGDLKKKKKKKDIPMDLVRVSIFYKMPSIVLIINLMVVFSL